MQLQELAQSLNYNVHSLTEKMSEMQKQLDASGDSLLDLTKRHLQLEMALQEEKNCVVLLNNNNEKNDRIIENLKSQLLEKENMQQIMSHALDTRGRQLHLLIRERDRLRTEKEQAQKSHHAQHVSSSSSSCSSAGVGSSLSSSSPTSNTTTPTYNSISNDVENMNPNTIRNATSNSNQNPNSNINESDLCWLTSSLSSPFEDIEKRHYQIIIKKQALALEGLRQLQGSSLTSKSNTMINNKIKKISLIKNIDNMTNNKIKINQIK